MQQLAFSPLLLLMVVAIAMLALRFLDPSGFIAIPVLFLPVVDVTTTAGIPPLVLTAPLLMAAAPFWFTYQNVWVAMGEGITGGRGYTGGQRTTLATVYAVAVMLSLAVAVLYWKLTKLL